MRPRTRCERVDPYYGDWARLVRLLAHPMRVEILNALADRVASPAAIADEIEAPLPNVVHHVNSLRERGCIELVGERSTGRSVEHLYRAAPTLWPAYARARPRLPSGRDAAAAATVERIAARLDEAIGAGVFEHELDYDVQRQQMVLDEEGWARMRDCVERLATDVEAIARRAAERRSTSKTSVEVALMRFSVDGAAGATARTSSPGSPS